MFLPITKPMLTIICQVNFPCLVTVKHENLDMSKSLNSLQYLKVFLVMKGQKLTPGFEAGPHQCPVQPKSKRSLFHRTYFKLVIPR